MYEDLIKAMRRYGLTNTGSLGRHMGVMDEAADAIAALQDENAEKDREIASREQASFDEHAETHYWRDRARKAESALSRVEAERDAAKKCIYDIETYLAFGSAQYIGRTIQAWKSGAQREE